MRLKGGIPEQHGTTGGIPEQHGTKKGIPEQHGTKGETNTIKQEYRLYNSERVYG